MNNMKNPNWIKNSIIYHIFLDRFSTGDVIKDKKLAAKTSSGWMGGNIGGVIKKLDYLKNLGINTIYLSPIYQSTFYHGYSITDYFEVDAHFGNKNYLRRLMEACHKANIRVLLDFVPNHCSYMHPFFMDAQRNRNSQYRDWFIFTKWPKEYVCFLDVKELPKINLENPDAQEHIISAAEYWIREFGIDGYRLDHAIGPPLSFWKEFKKRTKRIRKDSKLIAEIWFRGINTKHSTMLCLLKSFPKKSLERMMELIKDGEIIKLNWMALREVDKMKIFDGGLDFNFMELAWATIKNKMNFDELCRRLKKYDSGFSRYFHLISFLSNHDMGRFLYQSKNKNLVKLLSSLQFSLPRPVMIYYGEEIGLSQKGPVKFNISFSDVEARRFMIWERKKWDRDIFDHYRALCKLKNSSISF